MKRTLALLLVLAMALTTFVACNSSTTEPVDTAVPSGTQNPDTVNSPATTDDSTEYLTAYKTYFSKSYASFNYYSTAYSTVREIVANCIDGLVEPDTYGIYVPSIAESWTTNDDYTVWTFKIRQGVKWVDSTGAETDYDVTAQDFVDGIRYIGDPLNGAYSLRVIRNLISGLYDYYWTLDDIDSGVNTEQNRNDVVPSIKTLHAPHSPSLQPHLTPVRPYLSRSTSSRRSVALPS